MSVTAAVVGNVTLTDSVTGTTPLSKVLQNLSFTGLNSEFVQGQLIGTATASIVLPVSPVQFLYLKNLHATNAVVVGWTPNGGSFATVQTLNSGSALIFCQNSTASASGVTAISVSATGASTNIEYLLAG
jgi:hypothetical protein